MFKFQIGQITVNVTSIDLKDKHFVVEFSTMIKDKEVVAVVETNRRDDTLIHVEIEVREGIPF